LTLPVDNSVTIFFCNGFTANAWTYRGYLSLTSTQMLVDQSLTYFHIYVVTKFNDKVSANIHIEGTTIFSN